MYNNMLKKYLILSLSFFLLNNYLSAQDHLSINGREFIKKDSKWFKIDEQTNKEFMVNTSIMTVKLKNSIPIQNLVNFNQSLGVEIINVNKLGYINLKLPAGSNFSQILQSYLDLDFLECAYMSIIGESCGHSNDPHYLNYHQWHLNQNANPSYDIRIAEAWSWEKGNSSVVIAILDNGTNWLHEDISKVSSGDYGNIWKNSGDSWGDSLWQVDPDLPYFEDGIDNDGNGYIDDYIGWDFIGDYWIPGDLEPDITPDNNPMPFDHFEEFHGTGISGIVAAKTNNAKGISGISGGWNSPGSQLMILRVGRGRGNEGSVIADAIIYAADNGADIINMSFIITSYQPAIYGAIQYAYDQKDCFLVAVSGNQNTSTIGYPASHPNVFAVGASEEDGTRWYHDHITGSNYGVGLDVVAPGNNIYSTKRGNSEYGNIGRGTSYSAPQVCGVAALVKSYAINNNINLNNREIAQAIRYGATKDYRYPGFPPDPDPNEWNSEIGFGRLNAYSAIFAILVVPQMPTNIGISGPIGGHPTITWDLNAEPDMDYYNIYRAYDDGYGITPYYQRATVNHPNNSWTDYDVTIVHPKFAPIFYYYKVSAVDDKSYESAKSNHVRIGSDTMWKLNPDSEDKNYSFIYELYNNYPNPFNPKTTIKYSIKEDGHVSLKIYDILGKLVTVLVDEYKNAGSYKVDFNGNLNSNNFTSGLYFYILKSNNFKKIKKMMLVK